MENLRTLMERQIRKSMTWKPTCKEGRATFSQDFIVQSEEVFRALFKPVTPEGSKAWKMKKFSVDDFEVWVLLLLLLPDRVSWSLRASLTAFIGFDRAWWDKELKPAPVIITFALQAISPFVGTPRTGL